MLMQKILEKKYIVYYLLVLTFGVRLVFSFLPSFDIDMGTWLAWAHRLRELGMGGFYSDSTWTQYTPGYLYWLWLIGKLGLVNELMIKIPVILFDLATAYLIWTLLKKNGLKWANWAVVLYVLNPVLIFNGSVWGQIDGILTFFLVLSVYFLLERKNLILMGLSWAIAFLIKPQAGVFALPLAFLVIQQKHKIKDILQASAVTLIGMIVMALPFFPNNPILGLPQQVSKMTDYYSYTSVFAYNIWALVGMWKPDNITFMGLSYFAWGIILFAISLSLVFYRYRKDITADRVYLLMALVALVSFLFPTRVHERYLFPVFAFFLLGAGQVKSKLLMWCYGLLSLLSLINIYHPYAYYTKDSYLSIVELVILTYKLAPIVGVLIFCIFLILLFIDKLEGWEKRLKTKRKVRISPKINKKSVNDFLKLFD